METSNWRKHLPQGARQQVVNKVIDLVMKHVPLPMEELSKVEGIALRFEEKAFDNAISKEDYMRKINSKLQLVMTPSYQQSQSNSSPSGAAHTIRNSADQASHSPLAQLHDHGQSISNPLATRPQAHKKLSFQDVQYCNMSSMVQGRRHAPQVVSQSDQQQVKNAPCQQSVLQTSSVRLPLVMESASSCGFQGNQLSSIQLPIQSGLRTHPQSMSMQQKQPQQIPVTYQQGTPKRQLISPLQQQQQLQLPNATDLQDQLNGRQYLKQQLGQQNKARLIGQSSNLNMRNDQQTMQMKPQSEVAAQQKIQQAESDLLPPEGKQSQSEPQNQQLMSQIHAQPVKTQSQAYPLHLDTPQRHQISGSLLQPQHAFEQQKLSAQPQTAFPVVSSMGLNCSYNTRVTNGDDWKEEVYQKIKTMKDEFLPELKEVHKRLVIKFQQLNSISQHGMPADYEKLKKLELSLKNAFIFLDLPKSKVSRFLEEKLDDYKKMMNNIIRLNRFKRPISSLQQGQIPPHPLQPATNFDRQDKNITNSLLQNPANTTRSHPSKSQNSGIEPLQKINHQHFQQCNMTKPLKQQKEQILQYPQQPARLLAHHSAGQFSGNNPLLKKSEHLSVNSNKYTPGLLLPANSGKVEQHETSGAVVLDACPVISTPGLSPSPFLGECDDLDGNHDKVSTNDACHSSFTEDPIQRLIKVVRSMSYEALSASVSDIESVVNIIERTAGSIVGNGSRSAVGEDLGAITNFRLRRGKPDGNPRKMKMRRYVGATPSNIVASSISITDGFKQLDAETLQEP